MRLVRSSSRFRFLIEHDLRANASRVCREGTPVSTFPAHALEISQARKQRKSEQRDRADEEPKREHPETAAPLPGRRGIGHGRHHHGMLALDDPEGVIIGEGIENRWYILGFSEHCESVQS